MAFYPSMMNYFHPIINSLTKNQKKEFKTNPQKFEEALYDRFIELINQGRYIFDDDDKIFEEILDYNEQYNLELEFLTFSPHGRAKALVAIFTHYYITRVEADKSKGIALFEIEVAGTNYVNNIQEITNKLQNGDRLSVVWEKLNPYDTHAMKITTLMDEKIGYIPKSKNLDIVYLLKQEYIIFAVLKRVIWNIDHVKIKIIVYIDKESL